MKKILFTLLVAFFCFLNTSAEELMTKNGTSILYSEDGKVSIASPTTLDFNNAFVLDLSNAIPVFHDGEEAVLLSEIGAGLNFHILAGGGDDVLKVILPLDDTKVEVLYDGQNNRTGTNGDEVKIDGQGMHEIEYKPYNLNDGLLILRNGQIEFKGLEPVTFTGIANLTVNAGPGNDVYSLSDDPVPNDDYSFLELTGFEDATFQSPPSGFILINLLGGDDLLNFDGLDALFPLSNTLSFDGGPGIDELIVDLQGASYTDDGAVIQIAGSYTINYVNFETVSFINSPLIIPTMSEWGLIGFVLILMTGGMVTLLSRRKTVIA